MIFVLSQLWPWYLAIFLIAIVTSIWARAETLRQKIAPWLLWCGLAFALGLVLALLDAVQGRPGLWLETALTSFAVYIFGVGGGALARKDGFAEHDKWALGLVPAALVWLAANLITMPDIETDLAKSVRSKLEAAGVPPTKFAVEGRDVLLDSRLTDSKEATKVIDKIAGVRLVASTTRFATQGETVGEEAEAAKEKAAEAAKTTAQNVAQETKEEAKKTAEAAQSAAAEAKAAARKAAEAAKAAAEEAEAAARKAAEEAKASANAAGGAEKSAPATAKGPEEAKGAEEATPAPAPHISARERVSAAKAELKAVPKTGALDAAACQKGVAAALIVDEINFRSGSATIHRASAYVLDRIAALLQRCRATTVEIGGYTDNVGGEEANQALSQRRAEAVLKYLAREGVAAARMTAMGYGSKNPIASNEDEEGRALNRRIEMVVK